jgi:serine/threonine-protein kinase
MAAELTLRPTTAVSSTRGPHRVRYSGSQVVPTCRGRQGQGIDLTSADRVLDGMLFVGPNSSTARPTVIPCLKSQSMTPQPSIAHYRITAKLGEGGMGEVWRATDTKLGRDVALKILPASFARIPARMARFEREAKVLASLNHPHIAQIYGVEEGALVMELVEGEPLKGPLPVEKAVEYAGQILDALAAAHKKGIVHRDLKPANILVTRQGIKLLDFGLAKLRDAPITGPDETVTQGLTQQGQIVGTLQYMSPEQLNGREVDSRGDLFSFGCVLYEMLSGKRAFDGKSAASVIAAVLEREPEPLKTAPPLERLVKRALAKDPEQRFQTARDLKAALSWALENAAVPGGVPRSRWRITVAAATVLAIVAAVELTGWWRATRPVDHPLTRLNLDLGPEAMTGLNLTVAISPDGRRLVYPARGPDGKQLLATRLLDQAQSTMLPGTESGADPFFSPDGQWIGFFARTQLKKISVQGGALANLGPPAVGAAMGASWGQDGAVIEGSAISLPLLQIPAAGGQWQPFTKLGPGEVAHRWPQILPDAGAVLFTASPSVAGLDNANIEAISLKTGEAKIVQRAGYYGRYLASGHLVYVHQGVLFGVRFDSTRLEALGTPVPLLQDLAANSATGGGQFDFSSTGTFMYAAGKSAAQSWQVAWIDSAGKMQPLLAVPGAYTNPRLSPDGKNLAYVGDSADVYVYDMERDATTRLTVSGHANVPAWAPDGKHLVFESIGDGFSFLWIRSDGSGEPQQVLQRPNVVLPWSFSSDGRLAYFERSPETGWDLWTLPLDLTDADHPKPGKPEPFLRTSSDEMLQRFSPDGRWIAYRSNESGTNEIYVRPFPNASGGRWQVSSGGGLFPFWSKNGRELFYETADNRIMVVDYSVDRGSFVAGKPRLWSDKQLFYIGTSNLDLAPDGKRFAVLALPDTPPGEKGSVHVTMLLNFFDELKRRIP